MREFNLEEAKNGAKVQTRDGREARILWFDRKHAKHAKYPIIALVVTKEKIEDAQSSSKFYTGDNKEGAECLVMAPAEIFVNLYLGALGEKAYGAECFSSETEAFKQGNLGIKLHPDLKTFVILKGEI